MQATLLGLPKSIYHKSIWLSCNTQEMNEICFSSEIDRTALTEKSERFQESSQ